MRRVPPWAWRMALAVVLLATTYVLLTPAPPSVGPSFPNADKLQHAVVFAVIGALAVPSVPLPLAAQAALVVAYAAATEAGQAFVPGRAADLTDLAADSAGALVGLLAARATRQAL